jgi:hypothetical protein
LRPYRIPLALCAVAVAIVVAFVPSARRERDGARQRYGTARLEREQLRVRLADLGRRTSEDETATAANGASAARALRLATLRATEGLGVSGVTIDVSATPEGATAARGHLSAVGDFTVALRLVRRLARSSSGLLLDRVRLSSARLGVRVEADTFIPKKRS